MTDSEAKGFVQGKLNCMKKCDRFDYKNTDECDNCEYCYSQGTFGKLSQALQMAINALEKQIPKKPNLEGDGYADGHLVYDTWICPCCEKYYEVDYDDYDYCPNCGQAIDWSDEE